MIHDIKITSNRSTLTAKTMGTHEQGVLTNNMRIDLESLILKSLKASISISNGWRGSSKLIY